MKTSIDAHQAENSAVYKIPADRIAHMHGVAEYMYAHAAKYGLDPADMYLLGLLHDIGYLYGGKGHEQKGAELLQENGYPLEYSAAIEMHGMPHVRARKPATLAVG